MTSEPSLPSRISPLLGGSENVKRSYKFRADLARELSSMGNPLSLSSHFYNVYDRVTFLDTFTSPRHISLSQGPTIQTKFWLLIKNIVG